jgi:hypothetical protein
MMNWNDLTYLKKGNHRQRQAYTALHSLGLFDQLAIYSPTLAGTIPLEIDVYTSDLDILCQAEDLHGFAAEVTSLFGDRRGFQIKSKAIRGVETVIARFEHAGFPIEIFAQPVAVERQNGYRHMLVEHRLLELGGEEMREAIHLLKQAGVGTEPAFARYLHLPGDPYQAVLDLETLDAEALRALVESANHAHRPSGESASDAEAGIGEDTAPDHEANGSRGASPNGWEEK